MTEEGAAVNERSPLSLVESRGARSPAAAGSSDAVLDPISKPVPVASRIIKLIKPIVAVPLGLIAGSLALATFLAFTLSGIGPLIELYLSRRDEKALDRESILGDHPEMFLMDIAPDINKASNGRPYRVMVRITRPSQPPDPPLPPVILPGGLASNLMTMSRHQDELTARHGFTVVNFDRLGVGLSDPYPRDAGRPPSAADVAREMNYVMEHSGAASESPDEGWIQVGGSMGTNVATAFAALYPGRLCGFFNLDGLPHAFIQIQPKKFLRDGRAIMTFMRSIRWTGLPRLAFAAALRPMLPAIGDAFSTQQIVGTMCREQFFTATGLEYTTLLSCCDLEAAAWGPQATTEYDAETMRMMASLAPHESIVVDEIAGIPRRVTAERSESELGTEYLTRQDPGFSAFETRFRSLALQSPESVNKTRTHCNWPEQNPQHPVGDYVGGVDADAIIHPLAGQFEKMVIRVMCARSYKGLERDYTQQARNHAAARTSLHILMSCDGRAYYYPKLSHLNLWQQSQEVVDITYEMAQAIMAQAPH